MEADTNGDNKISWEEHLKDTYDYLPEEIEDFDKDDNPEIKSLYEVRKTVVHKWPPLPACNSTFYNSFVDNVLRWGSGYHMQ